MHTENQNTRLLDDKARTSTSFKIKNTFDRTWFLGTLPSMISILTYII